MYVVIGANGYLGNYLLKAIEDNTSEDILAFDLNITGQKDSSRICWKECDVSNISKCNELADYLNDLQKPLKIIYLASYHHPDKVAKFPKKAWNVNIVGLAIFLNLIKNVESLYYPSTEVVYGEVTEKHKFNETDQVMPYNLYGQHKAIAERMVTTAGYNVVRFPVLMGPSLVAGKKHFYDEIKDALKNGTKLEMFVDQKRSMIDFDTTSKLLIKLIENPSARNFQIVNICGDDALSKYELALRIAEANSFDTQNIIPVKMDGDSGIFKVQRAKITLLDNSLIKKILNLKELKIKIV